MSERHASVFMVTPLPILSQHVNDYRYGVVTDGERVLVVSNEGVSWWVTDTKPWLMAYPSGEDFGISREDMITLVNKSETTPVSLDKFIRSFGSRLECNFRLTEQAITENMFNATCDVCREMRMACDEHVKFSTRSI